MITKLLKIIAEADSIIEDYNDCKAAIVAIHTDLIHLEENLSTKNQSEL